MLTYNPSTKISPHFKMYEISKSSTAARYSIDNTPNVIVLEAAEALAVNVLEPIRNHFNVPFSPSSWFRCEQLERVITKRGFAAWCARKGLPVNDDSWNAYFSRKSHPKGEAVDIEIPGVSNDYLYEWIQSNIPAFDQVLREFGKPNDPMSGWVHVSYRAVNRMQALEIG